MNDWKTERTHTIRTRQELPVSFSLSPEEKDYFTRVGADFGVNVSAGLEFAVTPYYFSLLGHDPQDPLRRQCIPRREELRSREYEVQDPLSEEQFSPLPRMLHRYPDRVLVLVTDECAVYCRHCFRRYFASKRAGAITDSQLEHIAGYLRLHPEIHEVILSGGDPLTLADERVGRVLQVLTAAVRPPAASAPEESEAPLLKSRRSLVIRLATRIPVVMPQRITPALVKLLTGYAPLFVITQFNHPREITVESRRAVSALVESGVPVMNQAVLLQGVNDRADVLAELFQGLLDIRIKPYYLFQGDLAAGTAHFRVPLPKGFELMRKLRQKISGLAMPVYAVDLPGGGGKIPLTENYLQGEQGGWYRFIGPDGARYYYPQE